MTEPAVSPIAPPDPPLADEAINLRPLRDADAPAIAAACGDPEIVRWIPVPVPYDLEDARSFIAATAEAWSTGRELVFGIAERASGILVGTIGLRRTEPFRSSVGYWIAPQARRRGYATRAVRLVAAWAFREPGLARLELYTLVGNDASGAVAVAAGFMREGVLRRYLSFRGERVDAVMYSLLREELPT
jgi:RimJ/RimL family protein N-acetyltransferase